MAWKVSVAEDEKSIGIVAAIVMGTAARLGDTDLAWLGRMFWWVSLVPENSVMTSFVSPLGETLI